MTLEKLINELIKFGWKPWGEIDLENKLTPPEEDFDKKMFLTILCSIESGMRRFCIDKGLIDFKKAKETYGEQVSWRDEIECGRYFCGCKTDKYRIMLSSIQENKEQFILDNIILPS